ncbi:MAG: hypothetical protein ACO3Z6_15940 [Pseudomonadales bacterium]
MAITYGSNITGTYVGSTSEASSPNIHYNISGLQTNDLMIVSCSTIGATIPDPVTPGFQEIFGGEYQNTLGPGNIRMRMFWKFKTAGETIIDVLNIGKITDGGGYLVVSVRGVDLANPFDLTPDRTLHINGGGGGSAFNFPAMTPVTPLSSVLGFVYSYSSSGTPSTMKWASPFVDYGTYMNTMLWYSGNFNYAAKHHYVRAGYLPSWTSGVVDTTISGGYKETWVVAGMALRDASASSGGRIKYWSGASFDAKPVKVWNGSAWVEKPAKFWDGTTWKATS